MAATQKNREVQIKTPLGDDVLLLRDMTMTDELGRLFSIELELLSLKEDIKFEDLLGENINIQLDLPGDKKRFFNGNVSHVSQSASQGSFAVYHVTARPWLWFLTRTSDCRIFQEMTVPDIIKEVFREHGYTDFEEKLNNSYRTWNYCVQYRETDFNFVSRLMEQEGIYYFFKHEDGKHSLILADSYGSHEAIPDYEEIPYYQPDDSVVREKEHISHWHISKQVQPGTFVLNDFDFEKPKANLETNSAISQSHTASEFEIYDYPGEYIETGDGDNYVRTRIEELHAQFEQANGSSDARGMMTGGLFSLAEYPREDQNREYLVTSTSHSIHSDDYESSSRNEGPVYSNSFTIIDSGNPYRTARITPKPVIHGPQTAIVVGPSGEEIHTDEYSRVKLQFHWDRYGKSDENSSCWVRVSQLWAGKTWGGIHIPRMGQEVIVEFLEGDPDRPIITGRVYNADQMPPYELPANKTQSGIKSRSSKEGSGANFNEIRMEDKKGEEELYIHAEKNHTNITENDRNEDVGHDRSLHVGNDKSEAIDNNKSIEVGVDHAEKIGSNKSLSVGANHDETIGVDKSLNVGSNHKEGIGSNMTISVGSNLTETVAINYAETVGAAMELTIGAMFTETVGAFKAQTIGANKEENVGVNKSVGIGANKSEDIGGNSSQSVGGGKTVSVGKDLGETVSGGHTEAVTKDYALTAKNVSITAEDSITLTTGSASISMKKDGTINIQGKDISVKGSGKINVKASKDITMKGKKILQN